MQIPSPPGVQLVHCEPPCALRCPAPGATSGDWQRAPATPSCQLQQDVTQETHVVLVRGYYGYLGSAKGAVSFFVFVCFSV